MEDLCAGSFPYFKTLEMDRWMIFALAASHTLKIKLSMVPPLWKIALFKMDRWMSPPVE